MIIDGRPRPERALHFTPGAMALVLVGGMFGAGCREVVELALPTPQGALPVATLLVNLVGAFLLGVVLEALIRVDDTVRRRRARLVVGTGFMGAFTTYSTFAVEADLLVRSGHPGTAAVYVVITLAGGLLATVAGIAGGAFGAKWRGGELAVDPDVDAGGPDAGAGEAGVGAWVGRSEGDAGAGQR